MCVCGCTDNYIYRWDTSKYHMYKYTQELKNLLFLGPNQPMAYQALINNLTTNRRDNSAEGKKRQIRKPNDVQMIRTMIKANEAKG